MILRHQDGVMKTLEELIHDLPVDHLIAAILVIASLIFIAWELRFDPRPQEKEEDDETRYYVAPQKRSYHKVLAIAIFVLVFIGITLTVLHVLDSGLAKGRH